MQREIITTADGSKTIYIPEWNEHYHSKHGAIQEAYHVFINAGLRHFVELYPEQENISILEMGFGTGLNALITLIESSILNIPLLYTGVEAYPVSEKITSELDYVTALNAENFNHCFSKMHSSDWEKIAKISDTFSLLKHKQLFEKYNANSKFDIIYFDAFGARVQPELWSQKIFNKMFQALKKNGVLVTYAAKGSVRRAMQAVGFTVEKLPGPPGKREMLRASKQV